jgi:thiol:disulfide interchange protein
MFAKIIYTLIFLVSISFNAQNKDGIQFQAKSLEEAQKLAQQENKLIFIDLYTTWCGPCKLMAKNIFTLKSVGDHYNANFVNAKIDMEKGEGIDIAKKYDVKVFPTYLFIDGNGDAG